ncbi:DUF6503 family protein [Membranihabitans maritimus]|uniref:DUF6503 family protein n=1 Tax=Membranihabitans maritimus TaxID=2904244 RepID=UPI001F441215|nr:DUF6503 family protein [Membranihabitans maritimus]
MKANFFKFISGIFPFFLFTCSTDTGSSRRPEQNSDSQAQEMINRALETTNVELLNNVKVSFEFRDQKVTYQNSEGNFEYTRVFPDTAGNEIIDTLTNNSFKRFKNGTQLQLTQEEKNNLSGGINSIIYFAFLPFRLQDPAVQSSYSGEVIIKKKKYHKVKVTFSKEGGGQDHDDTFYYYFDKDSYSLDYLAYQYHTDGGGVRFRTAYNPRSLQGILVQDYINYKGNPDSIDFDSIENYYNSGKLKELSKIELKNVSILDN